MLAAVNLESVLKLKVIVVAAGQCMKKGRGSWGGGTRNRPREELSEQAEEAALVCVCVTENICFNTKEVFGTTLT